MAGIYIHIPFCKKRCIYCDFYSSTDNRLVDKYIDALCIELESRLHEIDKNNITTIYIGGGTPSQLSATQLGEIINFIKSKIDFSLIEEFTIEVNPDDVTYDYIKECITFGINRVSMGIQSFVDEELKIINRRHDSSQAIKAIETIKSAGISNISIDLIYGLPLQTIESWIYSARKAIEMNVPHISCYNLSYEEGTTLYKMRDMGEIKECDEDTCIEMYDILVKMLADADFEHYEISNFAKRGYYSRHNSNYWNLTPYLGLGASAHSFDGSIRRYNPSSIQKYTSNISESGIAYEEEQETLYEQFNEYIMINLRTMWGVNTQKVKTIFGEELRNHLIKYSRRFIESGDLKEKENTIVLSEKGIMLSDYIIRTLMFVP
jgi:oxygen-independent coproporphyrinogen-3 oxidase